MRYLLVVTMNAFFRAKHMAAKGSESHLKIGMAIHTTLSIVNKSVLKENVDHVIFCLEGRSWRKDFYEPYKRNRDVLKQKRTPKEIKEDEEFFEAYGHFTEYLTERTNCTVLQNHVAEADDMIARWIQTHPNDTHIILSSDSDFHQLLSETVYQYNGLASQLITVHGIFGDNDKPVIDKKTQEPKEPPNPEWVLFEKCIRGDSADNVFSAYPGVRKKGSAKRTGLLEAFADKPTRGYDWNNLMQQTWTDHEGAEHVVKEDYERNKTLIDLTKQPEYVIEKIDEAIELAEHPKDIAKVGLMFMRFCSKYDLNTISGFSKQYTAWLSSSYGEQI